MNRKVPSENDWGNYTADLDQRSAHERFGGKTNEDMQKEYYSNVLERVAELRFMPPIPFRYYVIGFKDFIIAGSFAEYEASDAANSFLKLVESSLMSNARVISPVMNALMPAVEQVANNQEKYEAPEEIYGCFKDKLSNIKSLYKGVERK